MSKRAAKFQEDARECLSEDDPDKEKLEKLYADGFNLDMDVAEVKDIENAILRLMWLADVSLVLDRFEKCSHFGLSEPVSVYPACFEI